MEIKYKKEVIQQFVGGVDVEMEVLLPNLGDEQEQKPTVEKECVAETLKASAQCCGCSK